MLVISLQVVRNQIPKGFREGSESLFKDGQEDFLYDMHQGILSQIQDPLVILKKGIGEILIRMTLKYLINQV